MDDEQSPLTGRQKVLVPLVLVSVAIALSVCAAALFVGITFRLLGNAALLLELTARFSAFFSLGGVLAALISSAFRCRRLPRTVRRRRATLLQASSGPLIVLVPGLIMLTGVLGLQGTILAVFLSLGGFALFYGCLSILQRRNDAH